MPRYIKKIPPIPTKVTQQGDFTICGPFETVTLDFCAIISLNNKRILNVFGATEEEVNKMVEKLIYTISK